MTNVCQSDEIVFNEIFDQNYVGTHEFMNKKHHKLEWCEIIWLHVEQTL